MVEDIWVEADILVATVDSATQVSVASVTHVSDTAASEVSDTPSGVGSDMGWDLV